MFERYGAGGYLFTEELDRFDMTNKALNGIASFFMTLAALIVRAVVVTFQWAFSPSLTAGLASGVGGIVAALRDSVYTPYVTAFSVAAAIWGGWHGLIRRRASLAVEGWVWAMVAVAFAVWFLQRPGDFFTATNAATVSVSREILTSVGALDPGGAPDDGLGNPTAVAGDPADVSLRVAADRIHRVLIHEPWLVGQFGTHEVGVVYGERLLRTNLLTAEDLQLVAGDPQALRDALDAKAKDREAVGDELNDAHPEAYEWYRGTRATQRVGVASLALLAAAGAGAVLLVIAASVIVLQLGALLLVLLSPVSVVVGIHPGVGRVIALRWLELLLGTVLKRIVLAALLSVLIVSYGLVMTASQSLGWGASVALILLLGVAAIVYRKPFAAIFGQLGLPAAAGTGSAGGTLGGERSRPLSTVRRVATTVAAAKTLGAGRAVGPPAAAAVNATAGSGEPPRGRRPGPGGGGGRGGGAGHDGGRPGPGGGGGTDSPTPGGRRPGGEAPEGPEGNGQTASGHEPAPSGGRSKRPAGAGGASDDGRTAAPAGGDAPQRPRAGVRDGGDGAPGEPARATSPTRNRRGSQDAAVGRTDPQAHAAPASRAADLARRRRLERNLDAARARVRPRRPAIAGEDERPAE